jgi:hypothetical protein
MTQQSAIVPSEADVAPWYDAVCSLWDDGTLYAAMAARGRSIAELRYAESVSRRKHVEYFVSLKPGGMPITSTSGRDGSD